MDMDEVIVVSKDSFPGQRKVGKFPYEYSKTEVVRKSGQNRCCVAFYEIPPGKSNYPYHYHTTREEIFYIIQGEGILHTHSGQRKVGPGDLVVCPPSERGAHKLSNPSDTEPLVYLDVDAVAFPDVAVYPDSGKIGIIRDGEPDMFFRGESQIDYYDGE